MSEGVKWSQPANFFAINKKESGNREAICKTLISALELIHKCAREKKCNPRTREQTLDMVPVFQRMNHLYIRGMILHSIVLQIF